MCNELIDRAITEVTRRWAAEAATEVLVDELLQQICFSDSKQICHEIFDSDVTLRLQTLKDCQRKVEILTLGRVFRKWRAQFSSKALFFVLVFSFSVHIVPLHMAVCAKWTLYCFI